MKPCPVGLNPIILTPHGALQLRQDLLIYGQKKIGLQEACFQAGATELSTLPLIRGMLQVRFWLAFFSSSTFPGVLPVREEMPPSEN